MKCTHISLALLFLLSAFHISFFPQNIGLTLGLHFTRVFIVGRVQLWVLTWEPLERDSGAEVLLTIPVKPWPASSVASASAWPSHPWEESSGELKTWRVPLETPLPTDFIHSAESGISVSLEAEDNSCPQELLFCFHWHQGLLPCFRCC